MKAEKLHLTTTVFEGRNKQSLNNTIEFKDDNARETELVNIYPDVQYQTIRGFGGAITESAGYIYSLMNEQQKRTMLNEYFGSGKMNYRFVRIPLDSCDFSLSHYEADSDENDEELKSFSIERTKQYILPMLRDAEEVYGEKLEIMLSPWSPPAYMKTNGQRNFGGKLREEYKNRWAEYICRYIKEFRAMGLNVSMLSLQNEPNAVQLWDSCVYTAEEEKCFLRDYAWPALKRNGIDDIKLYIWDHNKERAFERALEIIDEETDKMIAGLAFHWYSGDHFESLAMVRERFCGKELLLSEACIEYRSFNPGENLLNAQKYAHDMIGNFNAGMNTFIDWNLLLDSKGGPNHADNYCDAPFMFNVESGQLAEQELRAYIWHFSHFILPGSKRIGFSRYTDKFDFAAFKTDNEIVFIVLNRNKQTIPAYIRMGNRCAPVVLPGESISTGVII